MESCAKCQNSLGGVVNFCPYCGCAIAEAAGAPAGAEGTAPVAAVANTAGSDVDHREANSPPEEAHVEPLPRPVPTRNPSQAVDTAPAQPDEAAAVKANAAKPRSRRTEKAATPAETRARKDPVHTQANDAPTPQPPKKGGIKLRHVAVIAVVAFGAYAYLNRGPSQSELECNRVVDQAASLLRQGDLAGAREGAARGDQACVGQNTEKLAEVHKTIEQQEAKIQRECTVATRPMAAMLSAHRLTAANNALDRLPNACAELDVTAELRQQIQRATATAEAINERIKTAMSEGNAEGVRQLIAELEQVDRENSFLPQWRAEVVRLAAAQAPAVAVQLPTASPETQTAPRLQTTPPSANTISGNAPAPNPQNDMARQFLADAESALAQKRFDAARTYTESARRLDPNNPRVRALTRAIQERERQVLHDETTIN